MKLRIGRPWYKGFALGDASVLPSAGATDMGMFHFNYQDPPKDVRISRSDFVRIVGYLFPAWRPMTLTLGCIVVTSLLGLVPPLLAREVIDRAIPQANGVLLNWLILGMIGLPLIGGLIGVWQNYLVTVMSQEVMFGLRDEMYGRMLRQSLRSASPCFP